MKKVIVIIVVLVTILSLFTGCGKKEKVDSSDNSQDKAKDMESEQVVVTIFHHIGEQSARDTFKKQIEALEALNPNVKYEEQGIDFNQFDTMLKTKITAGDAPDIIMGRPKMYLELIKAGHIMDISDQPFIDNIYESAISSMKIDGKVYGIPSVLEGMGVFYNKDVFDKYGIEIPKTHSELMEAVAKLDENGIVPFANGFKDGWTAQCNIQSDFYGSPLASNPLMFKEITEGTKKFSDYKEFIQSIERYKERLDYSSENDFGIDATKARTMLIKGEAAMLLQGTWEIREISNLAPDAQIGFFTTPNSENPDESLLGLASSGAYMISSQTKHKEEALKFLEFRASVEGAKIDNADGTQITCVKEVPTEGINPITVDVMKIAESKKTYNYEAEDIFVGQRNATFRKWQEEFAADPNREVDKYIEKLVKEFNAIEQ